MGDTLMWDAICNQSPPSDLQHLVDLAPYYWTLAIQQTVDDNIHKLPFNARNLRITKFIVQHWPELDSSQQVNMCNAMRVWLVDRSRYELQSSIEKLPVHPRTGVTYQVDARMQVTQSE